MKNKRSRPCPPPPPPAEPIAQKKHPQKESVFSLNEQTHEWKLNRLRRINKQANSRRPSFPLTRTARPEEKSPQCNNYITSLPRSNTESEGFPKTLFLFGTSMSTEVHLRCLNGISNMSRQGPGKHLLWNTRFDRSCFLHKLVRNRYQATPHKHQNCSPNSL